MTEWHFEAETKSPTIHIPDFEDARSDFAPYYDIRNVLISSATNQVSAELDKLGAIVLSIVRGSYTTPDGRKRSGFEIYFGFGGAQGLIRVAALPFRGEATKQKEIKASIQALYNVRDWLKAAVTAQVFSPGSSILIPFLLVDGKHTVADYIHSTGNLPRLNPPVNKD